MQLINFTTANTVDFTGFEYALWTRKFLKQGRIMIHQQELLHTKEHLHRQIAQANDRRQNVNYGSTLAFCTSIQNDRCDKVSKRNAQVKEGVYHIWVYWDHKYRHECRYVEMVAVPNMLCVQ